MEEITEPVECPNSCVMCELAPYCELYGKYGYQQGERTVVRQSSYQGGAQQLTMPAITEQLIGGFMYTAQEKRERAAFKQFETSLPYAIGEVTVICPVCWQVVRTYETKVNDLNRYAFKYDSVIYRDVDGSLRTKQMYTCVERSSHGCDHVKPEPVVVKQELAPLPNHYEFEDIVFESNLDEFINFQINGETAWLVQHAVLLGWCLVADDASHHGTTMEVLNVGRL